MSSTVVVFKYHFSIAFNFAFDVAHYFTIGLDSKRCH